MSRFEDTVRRDLEQIADRATPSPDAWAQIQSRIADQEPDQETEIIMLTENTLTRRRWPLVAAAAAAVVALVIAIAAVNRDSEPEIPADDPAPTIPTTPSAPEADEGADENADNTEATGEADAGSTFGGLDLGGEVAGGTYQLDRLGVPISFEVPEPSGEPWTLLLDNEIAVSIGTDDGFVAFTRVGSFFDGAAAVDPQTAGLGSIPPNAIDVWIAATGADVVESGEVTIDGRPASYRRISSPEGAGVDTGLCPEEAVGCLLLSSPSADLIDEFPNSPSRVGMTPASFWFVELDDFEPLGIWVSAPPTNNTWLEQVQPLIDSITLGDPGPAVDDGAARVPERATFFASYSGTRTVGPTLDDGTAEVNSVYAIEGDLTGEFVSNGIQVTPANGFNDVVFTGTIEGVGSGTLIMREEWRGDTSGNLTGTNYVTGGTGDFAGASGRVIGSIDNTDESGEVPIFSGRMTFQIVLPNAG